MGEYSDIFNEIEGQGSNRLGRAAYLSADVNPDQEANLHKLGQRSGLPVEALRADNGQEAKRRATVDQLQMLPAHSPVVADYLSDLDNARVAHDDVESLSGIEKAFQVLKNSARSLASVPWSTSSGLWSVPRAAGDLLQLATKPLSEATGLPDFGGNLAAWSRYYQQGAAADAERIRGNRGNIGLVERGFYSGVESFGQNLMTLPLTIMSGGSTAPMLTSMSLTTGGQAYGEARDKGVDILPALNYSASQSLIEYATEKIPALTLVKNLKAKASLGRFARDMFATEVPGEQVATALQDLNDWAVLNPEKPFADYVAERPAAAVETLIATIVGTGGMVVTAKGLEKAGQSIDRYQHAQNSKNFLLAMGESAQASKLRERLPEKLQEAIKAMQEEHGAPEHAYVDAGKLTELWQSAGFDPQRKAGEMLVNPDSYFEALATGSEVAIPLDEFAAKFTGEKYYQDLVEDVRLGTGSMTAREAAEFDDIGRDDVMNELIAEAENLAPTASDLKVYDDVFGQLLGTGMERSTAERNAVLMQSVFRTLGQRTGVDALELYQRYPLTISRPLPGVLTQREQFDTVLDPLLDRLRAGDIPSESKAFGPSLLEFLREKGIKDDRGDLAALDIDTGLKAFTRKLLRDQGLSIDKAREAAVAAGYLPEDADINAMIDAIAEEQRGNPVYSSRFDGIIDQTVNVKFGSERRVGKKMAGMTKETVHYIAFEPTQVKSAIGNSGAFDPQNPNILFQGNRGVFRFGNGNFNIDLFQNADLSTVLHESSHFYFEILADLVTQENAPDQVKSDYQTLLNWAGAKDRASMTVAQLEQIARGFEAYIMEGNAPSVELQSVFSRMKAWLVNIYREIRRLNVKLNDDVRGVFDRLIATDDEIKAARERQNMKEVFATAADMGVSDAEFEIYRKQGERAHAAQIEKLEREYMKELTRQQREWWKEGLARIELEVDAESKDTPVYRAIQVLSKGVTFDGKDIDLKLDRKTLEKQYGKSLVKRLPRGIYAKEGGLTADVVAEMFGFESGDEMVKAMAAAPPREEYIKAEAERRMREIHGDLMTDGTAADEAIFAVHSDEQAKVLHEELRAMRKLQVTAEKVSRAKESENRQARKTAFASIPPVEFFKDLARDLVARKNIKDLMPHRYAQAEAKAAREAFEAAGKKKWGEAAAAKQRQILNHYLYREAATVKRMVDQQVEKWERFVKKSDKRLAASRDMNVVTAARAVLSRFGIGQEETDAAGAMQLIQQYDPDLYESLQMAVDVATQAPKNWKDLNVIEFVGLMDAVNNLMHLSRRSKVAMIDGRAVALDDIREELIAALDDKGKQFRELGKNKAVTDIEKLKIGFLGMGAALRRVEHWITEMDRGDSGPFRKFIYQPIVDAVTAYRSAKKPIIERLKKLFDGLGPEAFEKRDIPAQELGYVFKNKGELLHAILHTGNTSNFQKLLIGRGWGDLDEQQNLDRSRWDAFLDRMHQGEILTQTDYEFVQNVWDLLEGMKEGAQKAHHDMYGYYFSEITAESVVTPFGTFRGGYVPAITDPYQVESAAERADQENLLQDNASSMFPATTGKGFTMTRVAGYNRPLLLDMNLFPSHVDKVLRFSHMGPAIQDVGRIIAGDDIKTAFAEINPSWSSEMLVPWLKRTARQSVEMKNSGWGGKMADSFFRGLRRRTGLQLMAANLANATQQLTGIFPAMAKVQPRRIGSALFQFSRSPMEMTRAITEKSPWMKDRLENEINHLSGEIHQLLTQSKYDKAQEFGMRAGYWLSGTAQHLVDITVWQGAYEQAVKDGEQEAAAVNYADSIVRQTQGTFAPEDISSFEAGHPFVRLFTQFYSYFNMVSNLAYTEAQNTVAEMGWSGGSSRLFYLYMMTFALPSWMAELIMAAMRGKVDDDDDGEYIDDVLAAFFRGQGRAAIAMVPGVGAAINAAVGRFTKAPYDDKLSVSPAVAAIEGTAAVPYDLYQLIVNDKELKRAHVRDVFTMMGMLTGLPFAAAARPLGYAVAAESGATDPANALDYTRGLITGYAPRN